MQRKITIQDMERIERPRERMERYGSDKLSDEELLAIVLGSGMRGKNVLSLAKEIVKKVRRVGVNSVTVEGLKTIRGLGEVKAQKIIALLALADRLYAQSRRQVLSGRDVWNLCSDFYGSGQEHFVVFYLDTRGRLLERKIVFVGSLNESVAHPREVFEAALTLQAATVILAHNHPSGELSPSDADLAVTKRFKEAGTMLGITVQNHFIVSSDDYISIMDTEEYL